MPRQNGGMTRHPSTGPSTRPLDRPLTGPDEPRSQEARELNDTIRYTMWSVFRLADVLGETDRVSEAAEVDEAPR